jgi:NADH dehydrogenase FAD-containing subunit
MERVFQEKGIEIRFGEEAQKVRELDEDEECPRALVCASGLELPFHLLVWATGPAPHDCMERFTVGRCERGYVRVNAALQSSTCELSWAKVAQW